MCVHKCHAHPPLLYLICQQPIKDLKNWQIFSCSFIFTSSHSDTFSPQTVWLSISSNIYLIFARAKCLSFCADKRRLWEAACHVQLQPDTRISGYCVVVICFKTLSLAPVPVWTRDEGILPRIGRVIKLTMRTVNHEEILDFQCRQFCL